MTVFPQAPLNATVELQLTAGAWTDITHYAMQRDGQSPPIAITRGRPPESSQCNAGQASMQWNSRDGRFSRGNPTGPYYGQFRQNTPVRISVPDQRTYLRFADDAVSYISAPDVAGLQITGTLDMAVDCWPDNYTPSMLMYKWGATAKSWQLELNGDGTVTLNWWDGSTAWTATSTAAIPLGRVMIRAQLVASTGTVKFWTAATMAGTQTQLGSTVVTAATLLGNGSGQAVAIGHLSTDPGPQSFLGQVYEARIYSGVGFGGGGTLEADPVFTSQTAGSASFADAQSNTWTLHGTAALSSRSFRFHGECSSLPQAQDTTGIDVWTPVTASGLLRRLQQGTLNLLATMRRAILAQPGVVAYWPFEDLAGATQFASGLPSGLPMTINGTPTLATNSDFICSAALPVIKSAQLTGNVPGYTPTTTIVARFLLEVPAGGDAANSAVLTIATSGSAPDWIVFYNAGNVALAQLSSGAAINSAGPGTNVNGGLYMVSAEITLSGGIATYGLSLLQVGSTTPITASTQTVAASTLGVVQKVTVNGPWNGGGLLASSVIGHICIQSTLTSLSTMAGPLAAWAGETAGNRFARLCSENGIASRVYGFPNNSVLMGPQFTGTLVNNLQACEDCDRGQIYEPAECIGLGYRTLASMVNQAQQVSSAPLQLDWSGTGHSLGDGSQIVGVTDDDRYIANDMTVTRSGGSSYQFQLADGTAMSISSPPAGVGDYAQAATQYLNSDGQLPDAAGWLVHLGTVNDARYPLIPLNLARTELAAVFYAVQNLRLGDYLQLTSPPAYLTPNMVRQIVTGVTEELSGFFWRLGWQCAPESPYEVAACDDVVYGRCDTDGSTLHAGVTSVATTLQVDTTTAGSPLWTTAAGDFPFDIVIAGEQITVTNITGASSPQTFTVTRSVNGVVKAQSSGADVRLMFPSILALT